MSTASEKHPLLWTGRVVVSTLYVLLPSVFGLLCAALLLLAGGQIQHPQGFIGGAIFGMVFGAPLAIFQIVAIWRRKRWCAELVSIVYGLFTLLLIIGIFNLLIVGPDDESPLKPFPDMVFIGLIVAMNVMTSFTMNQFAKSLRDHRRNVRH